MWTRFAYEVSGARVNRSPGFKNHYAPLGKVIATHTSNDLCAARNVARRREIMQRGEARRKRKCLVIDGIGKSTGLDLVKMATCQISVLIVEAFADNGAVFKLVDLVRVGARSTDDATASRERRVTKLDRAEGSAAQWTLLDGLNPERLPQAP